MFQYFNAITCINNLRFWLDKNKANDHHVHDGYYWTYNSAKAFTKLFPYLNEDSIQRKLKYLENEGVIKSGNYNQIPYDRTKWYTIPAEYHTAEVENPFRKNAEPIPDNKTHIISDERTSLRESSSFEDTDDSEDDYSVEEVDEDGNPITAKKKKGGSKPKNKTAWNLIHYFQDLCRENLHAVPVSGAKEYTMVLRAMEKIGEDHVRGLITEWFSEGYEREVTIQLSRALSNVNLNKYIVNHGI